VLELVLPPEAPGGPLLYRGERSNEPIANPLEVSAVLRHVGEGEMPAAVEALEVFEQGSTVKLFTQ
jgi:hypothetical protein